jgi:hypothetical protein
MDQRPKCESYNYKTIKRKHRGNLHKIGFSNDFFSMTPKALAKKKKKKR